MPNWIWEIQSFKNNKRRRRNNGNLKVSETDTLGNKVNSKKERICILNWIKGVKEYVRMQYYYFFKRFTK